MVDQATINPETPSSDQTDFKSAISGLGVPSTVADPLSRLFQKSGEYQAGKMAAESRQKGLEMGAKAYAAAQEAQTLRKEAVPYQQALAQPAPKFNVTQDTQEGMMGLTALLPLAGLFMGAKGQMSGINAMNAMAGVLKGYQEGNQQRIAFEKQKYDAAMKEWDSHIKNIKAGFDLAVKLAATDREASEAKKMEAAYATGSREMIALAQKSSAAQMAETITKMAMEKEKNDALVRRQEQIAKERSEEVLKRQEQMLKDRAMEKISGQVSQLRKIIGSYVDKLGSQEIPIVAGKTESARQTKELADLIRQNPDAAGIAGKTVAFLDKYLPSRYGKSEEYNPADVENAAQQVLDGVPTDKMSEARLIQKRVLDVINARTRAVSNRFLISEFNSQKGVLDITNMSPKTAANVYDGLANSDIDQLRQYMSPEPIAKLKEYAGVGGPSTPQKNLNGQASDGQKITTPNGWILRGP